MAQKKEHLSKLLEFIQHIINEPGNEEFTIALKECVGSKQSAIIGDSPLLDEIYEYCIEKVIRQQAESFYKDFPFRELIPDLVRDFERMETFRRRDNFGDFSLAVYQQIERITNYICEEISSIKDITSKMWGCPAYIKTYEDGKYIEPNITNRQGITTIADLVFSSKEKDEKSKKALQELTAIDKLKVLVYFLGYKGMMKNSDYNHYNSFVSKLRDIYLCRNLNHRGGAVSDYQQKRYNEILPSQYKYYLIHTGVLAQYVSYIEDGISFLPTIEEFANSLDKKSTDSETKSIEINEMSTPPSGPKILGKIDLPSDNKKRFK